MAEQYEFLPLLFDALEFYSNRIVFHSMKLNGKGNVYKMKYTTKNLNAILLTAVQDG